MTTQAESGFATEKPPPGEVRPPLEDSGEPESQLEPTLRVRDLRVASLAYQQFRDRQARGDSDSVDDWAASQPCPPEQANLYRELHRSNPTAAARLADAIVQMPQVGAEFLGFELVGELGRGAFARAYLARQRELADRFVVLKISAELSDEPQTLAQLQHTNIVPIYSIHYKQPFLGVCMPYFGATTLQDVYADLKSLPKLPDSGKGLVSTLNAHRSTVRRSSLGKNDSGPKTSRRSPGGGAFAEPPPAALLPARTEAPHTLKLLEGMTYIEAVLWIGARLADGLAHAHEHGIYHRDLKPANVLLTDEGQPMLLDFNLSADVKSLESPAAALIGGTLPYMPPEQLDAFRGNERPVDSRSDIFALGIILYELLTRRHPYTMPRGRMHAAIPEMIAERLRPPPGLRPWNPAVPPAVESIIRHCLEGDPERRYQSARHLQEDLERLLDHRPLKYAPEPSLLHRGRRWLRRHPILVRSALVGTLVFLFAAAAGLTAQAYQEHQRRRAVDALEQFHADKPRVEYLLLVRRGTPAIRADGLRECSLLLQRYQFFENPNWQQLPALRSLPAEKAQRLRGEIGELVLLYVRNLLEDAAALPDETERARDLREALRLNQRAEECFRAGEEPLYLWSQRAEIYRGLKQDAEARQCTARQTQLVRHGDATGNLDRYFEALNHHAKREWKEAADLLEAVTRAAPQHYWAWFLLGHCRLKLAEHPRAYACYQVCITLRPDEFWAYFDRALVSQNTQKPSQALEDINDALARCGERELQADLYFNRGSVHLQMGRNREALADFSQALELGAPYTRLYFHRAEARRRLGQLREAQLDWAEGLRRTPTDTESWARRGAEKLVAQPPDLRGALRDVRQALALDRTNLRAWMDASHTLMRLGEGEEAIRCLTQALRFFPRFVEFRSGRGVQYARLGQRELAYRDAVAALADLPPPRVIYQVAGIYALVSQQDPDEQLKAVRLLSAIVGPAAGLERVTALRAVYEAEARVERLQTLEMVPAVLPGGYPLAEAAAVHAVSSQRNGADRRKALALLRDAIERGFGMRELEGDPELNPIRDRPEFCRLIHAVAELQAVWQATP